MFPPTLTTERLFLRSVRPDDAEAIFRRYAADAEVTRYLAWAAHADPRETRDFLSGESSPPSEGELRLAICVDADAALSGMITIWRRDHTATLGYALSRSLWGRGLMTEAVNAVCCALFDDPTVWRVSAETHAENLGSQRVLEKAGFTREGTLRRAMKLAAFAETQDGRVFARVREP